MDRVHDQAALNRNKAAQTTVTAFKFLADQAVADTVQSGAVVALDGTAQQAQLGNRGDELFGKVVVLEGITDDRQYFVVDKACYRILHHLLVFCELRAYVEQVERVQRFSVLSGRCRGRGTGHGGSWLVLPGGRTILPEYAGTARGAAGIDYKGMPSRRYRLASAESGAIMTSWMSRDTARSPPWP